MRSRVSDLWSCIVLRDILLKSRLENAKTRLPWLFASWVGGVIAASLIGVFENGAGVKLKAELNEKYFSIKEVKQFLEKNYNSVFF